VYPPFPADEGAVPGDNRVETRLDAFARLIAGNIDIDGEPPRRVKDEQQRAAAFELVAESRRRQFGNQFKAVNRLLGQGRAGAEPA